MKITERQILLGARVSLNIALVRLKVARLAELAQQRHARSRERIVPGMGVLHQQARPRISADVARVFGELAEQQQRLALRVQRVGHN